MPAKLDGENHLTGYILLKVKVKFSLCSTKHRVIKTYG
jgi:hypothetical protein